jgi:hypothetical protein
MFKISEPKIVEVVQSEWAQGNRQRWGRTRFNISMSDSNDNFDVSGILEMWK